MTVRWRHVFGVSGGTEVREKSCKCDVWRLLSLSQVVLTFACARRKNDPHAPRSTVQRAWKWLPETFPGPFLNFHGMMLLYFLRFHSSAAWWKAAASSCIVHCHQIPFSFWKSSVFHFPRYVSLYRIFLSLPGHCVYFSWCAWKRSHPPSLYPSHFLCSIPINCFSHRLGLFLSPSVSETLPAVSPIPLPPPT